MPIIPPMESEISLESVRQARADWAALNQPALIADVLPSEESVRAATNTLQSIKKSLIAKTKDFRAAYPQDIPAEPGIELLSLYQAELLKVRAFVKSSEAAIARLFAGLATVDEPTGFFRALVAKIRGLPNFELQLADLKSQAEYARQRAEMVASLRESREQLKHQCDEQVVIAAAALTQPAGEWDASLGDLEAQRTTAELSLKAIETELHAKTERCDQLLRRLREKDIDVDQANSIRNDQLESLKSARREAELACEEFSKLQLTMAESGIIEETQQTLAQRESDLGELIGLTSCEFWISHISVDSC